MFVLDTNCDAPPEQVDWLLTRKLASSAFFIMMGDKRWFHESLLSCPPNLEAHSTSKPTGLTGLGSKCAVFPLFPVLQFWFPSFLPGHVADHLLGPLLDFCSTFPMGSADLTDSLPSSPSPFVSAANTPRHSTDNLLAKLPWESGRLFSSSFSLFPILHSNPQPCSKSVFPLCLPSLETL